MFKNKAIQMSVVDKKADATVNTETTKKADLDKIFEITDIATEATIKVVKVVGVAIAANKVLNTVCDIAKIAAQAKLK